MNERNDQLYYDQQAFEQRVAVYLAKVMGWMCVGLLTTLVVGMLCLAGMLSNEQVYNALTSNSVLFGVIIAQIVVVIAMSAAMNKINAATATVMFMAYAALTGVTMSFIALWYTGESILFVFGLTAFIFVSMSVYGFVTKKDLTRIGSLAIFALMGIILGSVVNMFLRNTMFDLAITCIGIVIFIILIAYDTQKIKGFYTGAIQAGFDEDSDPVRKLAIFGALSLYLDFINLFLKLLRLFGKRRG